MSDNPYDDLLLQFQIACAKYGNELFFLFAHTREEWDADRDRSGKLAGCLGFIPLEENERGEICGYYIFGPLFRNRFGQWTLRWEEPFNHFRELAAIAGASLPLPIRLKIRPEPSSPVTWWLAFMWRQMPPSEDELSPRDGGTSNCRVIWSDPFLESVEAIQRGGLCTVNEGKPLANEATHSPDFTSVNRTEATVNDDSHLSPAKLAAIFKVPADPLRKRLDRWRAHNDAGWIENPDRGPREAKYVYRVGSVRPIIERMRATSETTSERPAKKK